MKKFYYSTYTKVEGLKLDGYVCIQAGSRHAPAWFIDESYHMQDILIVPDKLKDVVSESMCSDDEMVSQIDLFYHTVRGVDSIKFSIINRFKEFDNFVFLFDSWDKLMPSYIKIFDLEEFDVTQFHYKIYTSYIRKFEEYDGEGFKPVFITRSRVNVNYDTTAIWLQDLAPSWQLLNDWKSKLTSWDEYTVRYIAEQELENPNRVEKIKCRLNNISSKYNMPLVLLCFEKDATHCHRSILGRFIGAKELEI